MEQMFGALWAQYIEPWLVEAYKAGTPELKFVASGETGAMDPCTDITYDENTLKTCEKTIYAGQNRLWSFYRVGGPSGAGLAISHEAGHYVQFQKGNRAQGPQLELQADCVAGTWLAAAHAENPKVFVSTLKLSRAGSDETDQTHGTTKQRQDAFDLGRTSGPQSCNSFFPDTPLV